MPDRLRLFAPVLALTVAVVSLPAALRADTARPRLVLMSFQAEGFSDGEVRLLEQRVAQRLAARAEVLTWQDVASMLELESQKQMLACTDDSCLAEMGAALGAGYLVTGTLGQLGARQVASLALIDVQAARTVERASAEGAGSSALAASLDGAAEVLVEALVREHGNADAGPRPLFIAGAAVAAVGALVALGAGAGALWANQIVDDTAASPQARLQARDTGLILVTSAVAGAVVALVGAGLLVGDLLAAE